ncbi:unnamed protein product [Calypogeia fissa]
MERSKPLDSPPKPSTWPPAAKLATGELDCPSARLHGIQFGLLPSSTIVGSLSVITDRERNNKKSGITRAQDLFDARLGVPNKEQKCATCGGTRRGSCDGHFGHISLPLPIYHPLYVKSLPRILSSICLGCGRVLEKKKRKNDLQDIFDRESGDEAEDGENAALRKSKTKRKVGAGANRLAGKKRERPAKEAPDFSKWLMRDLEAGVMNQEWVDSSNAEFLRGNVKTEPSEILELSFPRYVPDPPMPGGGTQGPSNDDGQGQSELCKYCGGSDGDGPKFPKVKLKLVNKMVGKRARVDTIQMVVDEKVGDLPAGFWDFVDGHPVDQEKTRTLSAKEAGRILKKMPNDNKLVSNPEGLTIRHLLVSPNCNRLVMEDWSSTLEPRVLQRRSGPNSKLEAIIRKANQIKEMQDTGPAYEFKDAEQNLEELQLLAARHFRACKVVEYKVSTGQEVEETGGSLELKWLKANVLAKRSNYSARTIINGDPWIGIEEIGIPQEMARRLTVEEKINSLNIQKWQKFVNDYMVSDNISMPGAFTLKKVKENHERDLELLRTTSKVQHIQLGLGDTVTRCLKDGDRVFANRPPSLHKHSLVTLKVKVHSLSTIAINPLICPPFDADFDGDAFHVFVPQSLESIAETQELMTVNAQLISSQGGQPIIGLTQDSLVSGHNLTKGHEFIDREHMQQFSMWCSSQQMPIPAILKSPTKSGPLWTGKQLFSMTLPKGLNYGTPDWTGTPLGLTIPLFVPPRSAEGDVRIKDGELLVCQGGSKWLDRSPNGVIKAICNHVGPVATVKHLECLQAVLHQWIMITGFSVGLRDYYGAESADDRKSMLKGVQKSLEKANEASSWQGLRLDRQYQHRIVYPVQGGASSFPEVVEDHEGCFGLLLGDKKCTPRVAALQIAAIEKFQALAPDIENLVTGFMDKNNSLLAMVRSGSKGSMTKLTQQVGCLGLQLYKGEKLLPVRRNNKLSYIQTSLENGQSGVFSQTKTEAGLDGYWESRGIIQGSYLDGLNAREFFMDSISSRCNVLRQGIEEPNMILKNLMLFLRDMKVTYDGTVRIGSDQSIIQFQYGNKHSLDKDPKESLSCEDPEEKWADSDLAGEPVGVLAATSIAEPAYNVKMQSIHQNQVLGTGPVQLLKEVLMVRSKAKMKVNDRRCILRLPQGFGKELRALEIQRHLQRVTLEQITLAYSIEYVRLDRKMYVKTDTGKGGPPFLRLSPWMGHIQICQKTLDQNKLNKRTIVDILNKTHSCKAGEDAHEIYFSYSDHCMSKVHPDGKGLCIWCFPVYPPEAVAATTGELHQEKMTILLESMITIILPAVLNTTIRGSDNIEKVRIFWEDGGSASRLQEGSTPMVNSIYQAKRRDFGELVVEVVVKAPKGSGKRGASWQSVQEACILVMDMIDWRRSTPYAIQEIYQSYGVEAAHQIILKRLTVATKVMGKPVHQRHMTLVANTMTHCGDVTGLGSAGHREFCRKMSISAPFTEAAFQQPKKTFLDAAVAGASETIDGVLTSAVWGSRVPLGTGVAFQLNPKVPKLPTQKWPRDPLDIWNEMLEPKTGHTERESQRSQKNSSIEKSLKTQSLFQKCNQTDYFDMLEDLTGASIFQDGELAGMMLGKGKAFSKASIFKYGDGEESDEDSRENFEDTSTSPANTNGTSDSDKEEGDENEEDEDESTQKVKMTHEATITLQDGTNKGCNGIVERVGKDITAPAVGGDKITGGKRGLASLEEGTDMDVQPPSKLLKKDVNTVVPPVENDITILKVSRSQKITLSEDSAVPVAEEVKVDCVQESSNVSSEEASKIAPTPEEISEALTSSKKATSGVARTVAQSSKDVSKRQSVEQSSVPSSKRLWSSINILSPFYDFFTTSSKNARDTRSQGIQQPSSHVMGRDVASTTGGIFKSRREALTEGFHQQDKGLATSSEVVANSEQEQQIIEERKQLQNLLHVRYHIGDRVQADVEKMIVEDVLAHHPQSEAKIGCGIDHIKVDYHPDHPTSKCFHIVRKDGSCTDFSYHKCLDSKLLKLCNSRKK